MRQTADRVIVRRVEERIDRWLHALAEPENARRLQSVLAHVAQFGMELGFRADPHAAQLYEFVAWLEERHGRPPVLRRVAEHAATLEATILRALESIYAEPHDTIAREEAARLMHEVRDVAASDLLDLLCGLAALETGEEPPTGSVEARVAFFEEADLPEEFRALGVMAAGNPGAFEAAPPSVPERASGEERDEAGPAERSGLTRFVPSFDDPHLRFLTVSHLFFLQSYLTRNLVEALPELLEEARRLDG
jgi:hypothetical protein